MDGASTQDDTNRTEPPLWSIGLAVLVILLAPLVLYSLAPTGPLREGDTVFSDGQQRVPFSSEFKSSLGQNDTCLLDPGNPLIIVRSPTGRPDGTIVAQVQGNPSIEWPFCPAHAEVLLKTHQIFQKPDVFRELKDKLVGLIGQ